MLNESFSKATVATHGLDDVAPRHRYVPRAQHPPGEVLPPSQEWPRGTRATARPSAGAPRGPTRATGRRARRPMRGSETRPRADRGASDPHRSSEPPQGATVEERDDFRDNVLRDDSSRDNGHGRHEFAPPTAASRRGAVHDPVSTNEGLRGSRDAGGRQGELGAARGARRSEVEP